MQENIDGFSMLDLAANIERIELLRMALAGHREGRNVEGMIEN